MKKRGVSPVIATVLLIVMVIVIGLIIFLWFKGMTQEAITKFESNIELVCQNEVGFDASYSNGNLFIVNTGNSPIYGMKIKLSEDKSYTTEDIQDFEGLAQGASFSGAVDVGSSDSIVLIPVLLGSSEDGERAYTCDESLGYELFV